MRKALYILADLEDRDLLWLNQAGRVLSLSAGQALIDAGRDVTDLFFVIDGEFAVTLPNGQTIARLATGDVAGEMSFVEKRAPGASVIATNAAQVLAVGRQAMLSQFAADTAFAARFYRALAVFLSDRLRTATGGSSGAAEELDEGILDTLHVAGDRFTRLMDLLAGRAH